MCAKNATLAKKQNATLAKCVWHVRNATQDNALLVCYVMIVKFVTIVRIVSEEKFRYGAYKK